MMRKILLLAATAGVLFLLIFISGQIAAQPAAAAPKPAEHKLQTDKPVEGWVICQDLGVGPVPGVNQPRQRFKLCHPAGWEVTTYCLRPDLPAPGLGATCARVNEDTYNCGNGIQPVREYQVNQTPTATQSPTLTATQTSTSIPTATNTRLPFPTPTPTRRAPPGGIGIKEWLLISASQLFQSVQPTPFPPAAPTPTPFRPLHPTVSYPEPAVIEFTTPQPDFEPITRSFYGIYLWDNLQKVQVRIYPDRNKINRGQPIDIEFFPAPDCKFGDGQACANAYRTITGGETNFLTVHSGIGGEAQELRHALEGTGLDRAALSLKQVENNLRALLGVEVTIRQGDQTLQGLEIAALVRVPASHIKEYIETPVEQALDFAARLEPALLEFINSSEPLLILETCGWRMPGERTAPGISDTSSSIYIVVIRAR